MTHLRVEGMSVDFYAVYLREPHRPPSRGGNTAALHAHVLTIEGQQYGFLALGSQRWVFKHDLVWFDYEIKGAYRNIIPASLRTVDARGREVVRGNRGRKPQLRTAPARLPASRRERRE